MFTIKVHQYDNGLVFPIVYREKPNQLLNPISMCSLYTGHPEDDISFSLENLVFFDDEEEKTKFLSKYQVNDVFELSKEELECKYPKTAAVLFNQDIPIFKAIRENDTQTLNDLLKDHPNVLRSGFPNGGFETDIFTYCGMYGNMESVDVVANNVLTSILHGACLHGNTDVVKDLLERGTNISSGCLRMAVVFKNIDCIKLLINHDYENIKRYYYEDHDDASKICDIAAENEIDGLFK